MQIFIFSPIHRDLPTSDICAWQRCPSEVSATVTRSSFAKNIAKLGFGN